jgi:hypothetical protein
MIAPLCVAFQQFRIAAFQLAAKSDEQIQKGRKSCALKKSVDKGLKVGGDDGDEGVEIPIAANPKALKRKEVVFSMMRAILGGDCAPEI